MTHKQFAKLLFDWRVREDYTQQEASEKLGVSRRTLENWEQKRAMPQSYGLNAMLGIIQTSPTKPTKPKRSRTARKS